MWIQLVETAEEECKVKVTIGMDLNPFMKAMVQKPLQEGLEKMVDMLAVIGYKLFFMAQKLWEKSVQVNKDIERFTVGRDREMDLLFGQA